MPITIEKNQVLSLKITSIVEARKHYVKDGLTYWVNDIFCEDKNGNADRFEYITEGLNAPPIADKFVIGVYQNIRCVYPNPKGSQIEPYDKDIPQSRMNAARQAVAQTPNPPALGQKKQQQEEANCYSVRVNGESINFCMAWAKDLKVAEVTNRGTGTTITEQDLQDIIKWADVLNHGLCDRINFGK